MIKLDFWNKTSPSYVDKVEDYMNASIISRQGSANISICLSKTTPGVTNDITKKKL